ncbi:sulfatase [Verrucomicrobiaceae bacterium 5K15]|uniref:Sulfatase n=1 Tax=Oceaniferula flava TaxID=2800421 RepID=A0AAE2SDL5_9BACT|nr:sulfatase [Oceaniferula flavus]MBK1855047.1 sulfatase [Oceaniferula flavus]MBM1136353.1 sulfatase [Oceaniferula flavus]
MNHQFLTSLRAFIFSAALVHADKASSPLNFVFFIADDISYEDLGCYGHPTIKTPHIDRLASNGMRFNNAYLTSSSCSPSRCSIITGRYPHNTGAAELHTTLPENPSLFPLLLKDAGYYTALSGKHHMGKSANIAFSKISRGKGAGLEEDWVSILQNRPKNIPFFCWYASSDAHRDWAIRPGTPTYQPEDVIVPPYMVNGPETRRDLAGYYHEISRFDHYIGLVVEELERQNVLENTVIIVMADNGRPFPRCKTRLYDSGIKTPFIIHYPKGTKTGVSSSLISSIDVSATVLDLAKVPKSERIQGVSLTPIMKNPKATVRDLVFAEHNWHVYRSHERLVRMGDWLYIRNNVPDQQNLCVEAYIGGAGKELKAAHQAGTLTKAQMNIFQNPCPEEELYHVGKDPEQLTNLADNPENETILKTMRKQLKIWTEQTGDTLPKNLKPSRGSKEARNKKTKSEMPGASSGAQQINHPGPIRVQP